LTKRSTYCGEIISPESGTKFQTEVFPIVCPNVQFYAKCPVPVLILAVLTARLCRYDLQQFDAMLRTPLHGELTALSRPPGWIFERGKEGLKGWKGKGVVRKRARG